MDSCPAPARCTATAGISSAWLTTWPPRHRVAEVPDAVLHVDTRVGVQVPGPGRVWFRAQHRVAGEGEAEHRLGHVAQSLGAPAAGSLVAVSGEAAEAEGGIGGEYAHAKVDGRQVGERLAVLPPGGEPALAEQADVSQLVSDDRHQPDGVTDGRPVDCDDGPAALRAGSVSTGCTGGPGGPGWDDPLQGADVVDLVGDLDVNVGLDAHVAGRPACRGTDILVAAGERRRKVLAGRQDHRCAERLGAEHVAERLHVLRDPGAFAVVNRAPGREQSHPESPRYGRLSSII